MNATNNIPDDTLLIDLKPSRFLTVEDFTERWKVESVIVTTSRMAREETTPVKTDIDPATRKPRVVLCSVLYFLDKTGKEYPRGMLLGAKVNIQALKKSTGGTTKGEAMGKRITIQVETEMVKGHNTKVLRISPKAPNVVDQIVHEEPAATPESKPAPLNWVVAPEAPAEPAGLDEHVPAAPTPMAVPTIDEARAQRIIDWQAECKKFPTTAFWKLVKKLGINVMDGQKIAREKNNDYRIAFEYVLEKYAEQL
jgi:hypothetical protein